MKMQWKNTALILVCLILPFTASCFQKTTVEEIREKGVVTVLTRNNANCYYIYRDNLCGFEYDLAKAFSSYLGVKLKVVTPTWEGLIKALETEKGDFIAASMSISQSRQERLDFSDVYLTVQQKVIIHTNNNQIKNLEDLNGKTIHIRRGTSYEERLNELKNRGWDIIINLQEDTPTEEFIRMVAEKEIEVTIADSNIALLNRRYYPDVKIAFPIEEPQSLGWAVRKGEEALIRKINQFFYKIQKDGTYAKIYENYYANVEIFDYVDLKKFHSRLKTRLPKYTETIQKAARKHGFDWRFISAIIYQESHFNPRARSYTGVEGLMQLTQSTAEEMGVEDRRDPEQSIMGGVKYIKKLYDGFEDAKNPDRMLITLAGYNVGRGHILDAQKIAEEKGLDPNSWSSLEQILPLLCYPKYYNNTRYGYCRGTEPVRYVNRILTYYDILKKEAVTKRTYDLKI